MTYIAFIDESGDTGMKNIDSDAPYFALTAAIYRTEQYIQTELPLMTRIKLDFWGHDGVIFHDYDIKKKNGPFKILIDSMERERFWEALCNQFRETPAKLISAVIHKGDHKKQYHDPVDPYELCIQFVLERTYMMTGKGTRVVFESRGRAEDKIVRQWCEDICGGKNYHRKQYGFDIHFATKSSNCEGLQMADLACQPILHYVRKRDTERPDWLAVRAAVRCNGGGKIEGYGLKIFP